MPEQRTRPLGRPRLWDSEAERKRAYRARKAAELVEPSRLRDELRAARRALTRITTRAERATAEAARQRQRADTQQARADGLAVALREAKQQARELRAEIVELNDTLADAYDERDHLRSVIEVAGLGPTIHP